MLAEWTGSVYPLIVKTSLKSVRSTTCNGTLPLLSEEHEAKVNPIAAMNDNMSHLPIKMDLYDVSIMIYDTKIANIFDISAIKCHLSANFRIISQSHL